MNREVEVVDSIVETKGVPLAVFSLFEDIFSANNRAELWTRTAQAVYELVCSKGYVTFSLIIDDKLTVVGSFLDGSVPKPTEHPVLPREAISHVILKERKPVRRHVSKPPDTAADWFRHTTDTFGVPLFDTDGQRVVGTMTLSARDGEGPADDPFPMLQLVAGACSTALGRISKMERAVELDKVLERERILQEIHDTAIQDIFSCELGLLGMLNSPDLPQWLGDQLSQCLLDMQRANKSMREVLARQSEPIDSNPSVLDDIVRAEVRKHRKQSDATLSVAVGSCGYIDGAIRRAVEMALREALCNVRKHSGAKNVVVSAGEENGVLFLTVEDDGAGFDLHCTTGQKSSNDVPHFGLANITSIVERAGGTVSVDSSLDEGTAIRVRIPL